MDQFQTNFRTLILRHTISSTKKCGKTRGVETSIETKITSSVQHARQP